MDYLRCDHCGKVSFDVKPRTNPYLHDVEAEEVTELICDFCLDNLLGDI